MNKEKLLKIIKHLEEDDLEEDVVARFLESGSVEKEEWNQLSNEEKVELINNIEVYEWQDYYIGFYSALNMLKNQIEKL